MERTLREKGLWQMGDGPFRADDIIAAWRVMARLGMPYRVEPRASEGRVECRICDPGSGEPVCVGQGSCGAEAMCAAAMEALRSRKS